MIEIFKVSSFWYRSDILRCFEKPDRCTKQCVWYIRFPDTSSIPTSCIIIVTFVFVINYKKNHIIYVIFTVLNGNGLLNIRKGFYWFYKINLPLEQSMYTFKKFFLFYKNFFTSKKLLARIVVIYATLKLPWNHKKESSSLPVCIYTTSVKSS